MDPRALDVAQSSKPNTIAALALLCGVKFSHTDHFMILRFDVRSRPTLENLYACIHVDAVKKVKLDLLVHVTFQLLPGLKSGFSMVTETLKS